MQNLTTLSEDRPAIITGEIVNRWIDYIDGEPRTVDTYQKNIRQFIKYLSLTGTEPNEATRETIKAYKEYLLNHYTASTAQGYLQAVKLFYKWTASEGIFPNIAERIKAPKIDRDFKHDYLTAEQAGNLLRSIDRETVKGKRDYAIISLMLTTGLRTQSIQRANISDIRTHAGTPVLYYYRKGFADNRVYAKLPEEVYQAIQEYLTARKDRSAALFCSISNRNAGERMTIKSISRAIKEAMIHAGYNADTLTAHSLRHTAATLNLLNGGTLEETMQLLNHQNINTTLIYSHALAREANDSEKRIASAIFNQD